MKVLTYEGLERYHELASQKFDKTDDIAAINNRIETIDSEIDTINVNIKPSDWNQTNSAAVDFIKNKPTILTSADVSAQIKAEVGDNIDISAITNSEIDAICV